MKLHKSKSLIRQTDSQADTQLVTAQRVAWLVQLYSRSEATGGRGLKIELVCGGENKNKWIDKIKYQV